jgi:hypothetical protein
MKQEVTAQELQTMRLPRGGPRSRLLITTMHQIGRTVSARELANAANLPEANVRHAWPKTEPPNVAAEESTNWHAKPMSPCRISVSHCRKLGTTLCICKTIPCNNPPRSLCRMCRKESIRGCICDIATFETGGFRRLRGYPSTRGSRNDHFTLEFFCAPFLCRPLVSAFYQQKVVVGGFRHVLRGAISGICRCSANTCSGSRSGCGRGASRVVDGGCGAGVPLGLQKPALARLFRPPGGGCN